MLVTTGLATLVYVSIKSHLTRARFERFTIDQNDNTRLRRLDRWFDGRFDWRNDGAACDGRRIEALATWGKTRAPSSGIRRRRPWKYPGPSDYGVLRCPRWDLASGSLAAGAAASQEYRRAATMLSKVQSVDQRMRLRMRCRLSPTADVPSHTSGGAIATCGHQRAERVVCVDWRVSSHSKS
jgi:hypothetical protein